MGKEIEFIDLMNNETLSTYHKIFNKILKKVKKELNIKEKVGLSLTFCDNKHIRDLNKTYRKKDDSTDVLSFALEDNEYSEITREMQKLSSVRELGDIVISHEKAQEQALEYNHSIKREVCFLFTHGLLHLLGYDHINRTDEEMMITMQNKIMDTLKIKR